jgi:hypothetical protein
MGRTAYFSVALLAGLWVLGGCGSQSKNIPAATKEPSSQKSAYDCDAHQSQAVKRLSEVVDAHKTCSIDVDCVSVGLSTICSDQCSTSINQEGAKMLSTAISMINAEACAGYTEANCQLIHPPCAPSRPPACVSEICQ